MVRSRAVGWGGVLLLAPTLSCALIVGNVDGTARFSDATAPQGDASTPSKDGAPGPAPDASPRDAATDTTVDASCTTCGGSCVDTTTSPTNCGGCGVVCMACTAGYCLQFMDTGMAEAPGPDGGSQNQLIAGVAYLSPLLYWAGYAANAAFPGDNTLIGNSTSAASKPDPYEEQIFLTLPAAPAGIVSDGTSVFLGGHGYVASFTPPTPLTIGVDSGHALLDAGVMGLDAGGVDSPSLVAVDGSNVYWTDASLSAVLERPKSGGTVVTLATDQFSPTGLAVDGANVYWIASRTLWSLPVGSDGGSAPRTLAAATGASTDAALPTPIVAQGAALFWGDPGSGTIFTMLAGGGTPEPFATQQPNVTAMASDGADLYWTTSTTTGAAVVKAALAGGAPLTIGSFAEPGAVLNGGLALKTGATGTTIFTVVDLHPSVPESVLVSISAPPTSP